MKQSNKKGIKRKCCRGCGGHATTLLGQLLWATWCLTNNREKGKIVAVKGVKS